MTVPVLLGLDVSPTKAGIGVVRDEDGTSVLARVSEIDGPVAIHRALMNLEDSLLARDVGPCEPSFAYIERPDRRSSDGQLEAGIAVGMWLYALARRFPWIPVQLVGVQAWRSSVGIGPAPKNIGEYHKRQWLKARAIAVARELGFELPIVGKRVLRPSDDAAEGALIARAAWVDLEAGKFRRINRTAA